MGVSGPGNVSGAADSARLCRYCLAITCNLPPLFLPLPSAPPLSPTPRGGAQHHRGRSGVGQSVSISRETCNGTAQRGEPLKERVGFGMGPIFPMSRKLPLESFRLIPRQGWGGAMGGCGGGGGGLVKKP